jgi:hypothetical protein
MRQRVGLLVALHALAGDVVEVDGVAAPSVLVLSTGAVKKSTLPGVRPCSE